MALTEPDEPSELRRIVRVLPRKRTAIVTAIVAANVLVGWYCDGDPISRDLRSLWPWRQPKTYVISFGGSGGGPVNEVRRYEDPLYFDPLHEDMAAVGSAD